MNIQTITNDDWELFRKKYPKAWSFLLKISLIKSSQQNHNSRKLKKQFYNLKQILNNSNIII